MQKDYRHLKEFVEPGVFEKWQEVDAVIYAFTDMGIKVSINDEYTGLVYENEIFDEYHNGQKIKAFIKAIRADGKIDVSLQPNQGNHVYSTADRIFQELEDAGGKLRFNDLSTPEEIKKRFQISKTVFKQAIGKLYKQRKIKITDKGIEIV